MNGYSPIDLVVEKLESQFDWTHSFIRECYLTTARNFVETINKTGERHLGDVGGPQHARIVVACAGNSDNTGVEFVFKELISYSIQQMHELSFRYTTDIHVGHMINFVGDGIDEIGCYFAAKSVMVKFLGREYQGPRLRLGFEYNTSEPIAAKSIEGDWRQCSNCSNIWREDIKISICRCPSCQELTELMRPV